MDVLYKYVNACENVCYYKPISNLIKMFSKAIIFFSYFYVIYVCTRVYGCMCAHDNL